MGELVGRVGLKKFFEVLLGGRVVALNLCLKAGIKQFALLFSAGVATPATCAESESGCKY